MLHPPAQEVLECLPQAVTRVDGDLCVEWVEPAFARKTTLSLEVGQSLRDCLEPGAHRDLLEAAVSGGKNFSGHVITKTLHQLRIQVRPVSGTPRRCWVIFEACGVDEELSFARAMQEIAVAVGQTLDVDSVCAAAVVAMVRCAGVCRAEVYLRESEALRRVASSDLAGSASPGIFDISKESALKEAFATSQPQLGVAQAQAAPGGASIFAIVPLLVQGQSAGVLVLFKERGTSFSIRELDLWSAAAAQLAVAVENARLLRQAQAALKIRDEFMSIASHELKTPLTPLKLTLYTMERRLAQALPVELKSIATAKRQVERLAGLVNELLDVSRLQLGKVSVNRVPVELGHLATEVVDEFRAAFDRNFEVVLPAEPQWVWGERDRLEQVLVNLLENAQKYSPQEQPIRIELARRNNHVRLKVIDRGIGIPASDQSQVFERFYRAQNATQKNFGGLGLGLFISRSILQLHGGELVLESVEGQGTTFTLALPAMPQREERKLLKRVLVVDEDPIQEERARALLQAEGFEVFAAKNCAEALHRLAEAPVDLMLVSSDLACRPDAGFVHALHAFPTCRPIPLVFGGFRVPGWAEKLAHCCNRPYQPWELGPVARKAMGLPGRRSKARQHQLAG